LPHALASSLVHGHGGAEAFGSNAVQDQRVARLRAQVEMRLVAEELPWPQDRPAFVTLVGADGKTYSASCLSARGGPDRPFGEEELWDKIDGLSRASTPGLVAAMQQLYTLAGDTADAQLAQPWRQWVDRFFDPAATRA
jgi:2-methylcitrate dehydratase PrpD